MNAETWFSEQLQRYENDAAFLTDDLLVDVTDQIASAMTARGLRAVDLAARLGVSRAYVSQLLNGRPNLTVRTLVDVAHALDQRVEISLRPRGAARTRNLSSFTRPVHMSGGTFDDDQSAAAA